MFHIHIVPFCILLLSLNSMSSAEDACTLAIKIGNIVSDAKTDKVYLTQYIGTQRIQHNLTTAHITIPNSSLFDKTKPMVIVAHGFLPGITNNNVKIVEAIEKTKTVNVFYLDYSAYALNPKYPKVVVDVIKIGQYLGTLLSTLKDKGVHSFHLIGHSLGAHLNGFAGKQYKKLKSSLLDRITGLDCAGPCFINEAPEKRLDLSDAAFVDVMHTDVQLGMLKSIGHVDFYPNGGDNMPGIFNNDHVMSQHYFLESVTNNQFLSVNCQSWDAFLKSTCKNNEKIPMGYWTPTTARNKCYLKTKDSPNYALGNAGIV